MLVTVLKQCSDDAAANVGEACRCGGGDVPQQRLALWGLKAAQPGVKVKQPPQHGLGLLGALKRS